MTSVLTAKARKKCSRRKRWTPQRPRRKWRSKAKERGTLSVQPQIEHLYLAEIDIGKARDECGRRILRPLLQAAAVLGKKSRANRDALPRKTSACWYQLRTELGGGLAGRCS